jgi:malonyl-CoA/methylmalonyl-CoA synthetase
MTDPSDANLFTCYQQAFPIDRSRPLLTSATGKTANYAEAERRSAQIANGLLASGAQAGDRVTVQVRKSPESLYLYLACLRAGLVYHPLNTAYQAGELAYFLGNAEPAIVVCDSAQQSLMSRLAPAGITKSVLTLDGDGSGSLMECAGSCAGEFETVHRNPEDLAALLYSSGTTGQPKGIMLTHSNLASSTATLVKAWEFTADDCLLHALPIFHVHGLFVALGCVLGSGASMQWLEGFSAEAVMAALPKCTVMMGVPTYYTRLLANPAFPGDSCNNMRLFVSGSAPLLAETFAEFQQRTGHAILERYGMTETSMNTSNPLHGERRPGTVGPPLPGVEARVVDEQGNPLSPGETGNLQVRGPNVFPGYWRLPEKTAEDFTADGFFDTGDKATIDIDGYVSIVGRAKDMIISGGLNIYPKEIELLLDDMEGVEESAVIGVPHPDFGEAVVAVIVPTTESGKTAPDTDSVINYARAHLANFKVPKQVHFVDELPRNAMGKVQKNLLRERYI